jgi:hypothetical protein
MRYLAPITAETIPAVTLPLERCVYCWYTLHPTLSYPVSWSSTCCPAHHVWVLAKHTPCRATRSSEKASRNISLVKLPLIKKGHG